jgi:hypothetical protein
MHMEAQSSTDAGAAHREQIRHEDIALLARKGGEELLAARRFDDVEQVVVRQGVLRAFELVRPLGAEGGHHRCKVQAVAQQRVERFAVHGRARASYSLTTLRAAWRPNSTRLRLRASATCT